MTRKASLRKGVISGELWSEKLQSYGEQAEEHSEQKIASYARSCAK